MYTEYLGIKEKPFSITPDPRYLYMSQGHQDALAHLMYGIVESGGFVVLTGEVGTGKTSLCRCLLEQLPQNVEIALIVNPVLTRLELVAAICDEFGIEYPPDNQSQKLLIDLLNSHLLDAYAQGKHCVLMIDEAQNLAPDVLEQVRLLTNLETDKKKLLQIILVGQPELNVLLQRQDMRQLNQRITARYHLAPLSADEMHAYIRHRLSVAGLRRMIFTPDALKEIYKHSGGVPRLINIICDRCLLAAYATERADIGRAIARSAVQEVIAPHSTAGGRKTTARPWAAAIAISAAVLGLLFIGQSNLTPRLLDHVKTSIHIPLTQLGEGPASGSASPQAAAGDTEASRSQQNRNADVSTDLPAQPASETTATGPSDAEAAIALLGSDGKVVTDDHTETADTAPPAAIQFPIAEGSAFSALPMEGAGLRAALEALFSLWDKDYDALTGDTPCSRARSAQLACLLEQDGWKGLYNLNRPALITLNVPEQGRVHALISELTDDKVTLQIGGAVYESTTEALTPYWSGEYLIFWRPPGAFRRILRDGAKGPDVYWLRLRLANEDASINLESDSFDSKLRDAVAAFQESRALKPNGIVDARTLIHLNSLDPTRSLPLLHPVAP